MAVRAIRITGDPVLHSVAEPVRAFDAELDELVDDMIETMHAAPGVGLAAPQVGVPLRVFVYDWTDDDGERHEGVAVNPELFVTPVPVGPADEERDSEGCLSIPGERFPLVRAEAARLRAQDRAGSWYEVEASGWLARIFQHEYDHLDGILYADRLADEHLKAVAKVVRKRGWGVDGQQWMPGVDDLEG